jgi:NAD(P)-dependent dehydrogenase (short-subunit alcohol dehydrogenase family)
MSTQKFAKNATSEDIMSELGGNVQNKVYFVTGANSGIGCVTVKWLLKFGATVVMGCRSDERGRNAYEKIIRETSVHAQKFLHLLIMDLSDLDSVKNVPKKLETLGISKIDCLINNAGIMAIPEYTTSAQGIEIQWATNHLGHFLLTKVLAKFLDMSEEPRVVNVSSLAHDQFSDKAGTPNIHLPKTEDNYEPWIAYGNSKACNVLFTNMLMKKHPKWTVCSLHPGVIKTNLANSFFNSYNYFARSAMDIVFSAAVIDKSEEQGAATTLVCAATDKNELVNGGYYADCNISKMRDDMKEDKLQQDLWNYSEELVAGFAN